MLIFEPLKVNFVVLILQITIKNNNMKGFYTVLLLVTTFCSTIFNEHSPLSVINEKENPSIVLY